MTPAVHEPFFLRLPNWIGDAVMVLPALRSLPGSPGERVAAAHPRVHSLYAASGLVGDLLPARGASATWRLARAVRARRPRTAVVFTEALSGAALALLSAAPVRVGRRWAAFTRRLPAGDRRRPLWRAYMEVAEAAGGHRVTEPDFTLSPPSAARERAARWLPETESRIALAPGAAYGPAKAWPVEHFREVAQRAGGAGHRVVWIGGPAETPAIAELATAGEVNLSGRTSLVEAIAVLQRCRALVSNDSGALHLGRAAGIPVVGVYGSTSPVWTGPEPGEGTALHLGLDCSPCFRRACPLTGDAHLACLRGITPQHVWDALNVEAR